MLPATVLWVLCSSLCPCSLTQVHQSQPQRVVVAPVSDVANKFVLHGIQGRCIYTGNCYYRQVCATCYQHHQAREFQET